MRYRAFTGLLTFALSATTFAGSWYGDITYTGADGGLPESPIANVDNRDTGWQITAGFDVNRHFSVELGYVDFGQQNSQLVLGSLFDTSADTYFNPFTSQTGLVANRDSPIAISAAADAVLADPPNVTTETTGIRLAGIGKLALTPSINLDFQAGALVPRYKTTEQFFSYDFQVTGLITNLRLDSRTETSNEPEVFLGMGIYWAVNPTVGVKVFWEKLNNLGNEDTLKQDLDTYNLALRYQF